MRYTLLLAAACLAGRAFGGDFSGRFEEIKRTAKPAELYTFLYALPKGGDLHNHLGGAIRAEWWYAIATDPARNGGDNFYTRTKFTAGIDTGVPLVLYHTIRRYAYEQLDAAVRADWVRPGIAVYGLSPVPALGDMGLRPAMTLKCPVAMVKSISAGDGVSYGHAWVADRDTTVALLPLGYADGVFRMLSGRIDALINGRLRRNVGRICMDQFLVDLGPGPVDVAEGDDAILFGPGGAGEPTAQTWADLLGTINYEVVTSPRGRVRRSYTGGDSGGG